MRWVVFLLVCVAGSVVLGMVDAWIGYREEHGWRAIAHRVLLILFGAALVVIPR